MADGTCENDGHVHEIGAVGEEKDGTPFRIKKCRDCGIEWKEYKDWDIASTLDSKTEEQTNRDD